jgi:quercetin dioxygenase-like cupin family protein
MPRCLISGAPLFVTLVLGALLVHPVGAQTGRSPSGPENVSWENSRIRLKQLSVEPGATLPTGGDQVMVYLTADADGRLPAEAVWQPGGTAGSPNRGSARLQAIAIELKDVPPGAGRGTLQTEPVADDRVSVTTLIDNPRVLVTKHSYGPITLDAPAHLHPEDVLVVYLRGGYTWPQTDFWGASRVRRGDVEVIPANTYHRLANAGGDPMELLVIVPR